MWAEGTLERLGTTKWNSRDSPCWFIALWHLLFWDPLPRASKIWWTTEISTRETMQLKTWSTWHRLRTPPIIFQTWASTVKLGSSQFGAEFEAAVTCGRCMPPCLALLGHWLWRLETFPSASGQRKHTGGYEFRLADAQESRGSAPGEIWREVDVPTLLRDREWRKWHASVPMVHSALPRMSISANRCFD